MLSSPRITNAPFLKLSTRSKATLNDGIAMLAARSVASATASDGTPMPSPK